MVVDKEFEKVDEDQKTADRELVGSRYHLRNIQG